MYLCKIEVAIVALSWRRTHILAGPMGTRGRANYSPEAVFLRYRRLRRVSVRELLLRVPWSTFFLKWRDLRHPIIYLLPFCATVVTEGIGRMLVGFVGMNFG